jgi:ribosome biogenesis GTPase
MPILMCNGGSRRGVLVERAFGHQDERSAAPTNVTLPDANPIPPPSMAKKKPKQQKIRAEFRKKHQPRARKGDLTRDFQQHGFEADESVRSERISGKGDLTRKRTIVGAEVDETHTGLSVRLSVDESTCRRGRVLSVFGLSCDVVDQDGRHFQCATSGVLRTLSTDQRHVVAAGDRVWFRPEGTSGGMIERIEPRRGVLSRSFRGRQHVIVSNVDQLLIIGSASEPMLKPNLIDRFLVAAEQGGIEPIICLNKIDLVDPADLQPLVGVFGQMGYRVLLLSAATGFGIDGLQDVVQGRQSVVAGQSGVGKSSLLNALDPQLELKVRHVSVENQKGRHTTTAARLIPLEFGGYILDTPGIRQFQLWDVIAPEVAGLFRDIRPYVSLCRFPNCTHTHEAACAVKDAVADGRLDARRYESYCFLFAGDE